MASADNIEASVQAKEVVLFVPVASKATVGEITLVCTKKLAKCAHCLGSYGVINASRIAN